MHAPTSGHRRWPSTGPWPLLVVSLVLTRCEAPLGYTRCSSDADCPATLSCDLARSICHARAEADAAAVDGAFVDASLADREAADQQAADQRASDHAGPDGSRADATSVDATAVDTAAVDGAAGDAGQQDAATTDTAAGDGGNLPPTLTVLASPGLYPGTSITWQASASDPDGAAEDLTVAWELVDPPAGVFMDANQPDPLRPLFWVTRELYADGPQELQRVVRLTVTDGAGAAASTEAFLRVLDERGPHVDAQSSWQGTGYDPTSGTRHGYCGAPGHACNNIQDAIDNLHDAQLNDGLWSDLHEVRVASTGIYSMVGPIRLGGNALSCGWSADFATRRGATARSQIAFSGDVGVQLQTSSAIDGCEIVGVEPLNAVGAARIAVSGVDVGLVFRDSRAVGSATASQVSGWAVGLDLTYTGPPRFSNIEDSEIEGGVATTFAVGLNLGGGSVRVARSALRGGQAEVVIGALLDLATTVEAERSVIERSSFEGGTPTEVAGSKAVGLAIAGGNPRVRDGSSASGGTSGATVIGLSVGASATGVHVEDSAFVGLTQGFPGLAYGALVQSALNSVRGTYTGGNGSYGVGLYAEVGRAPGTTLSLTDDVIEAGEDPTSAFGLVVGDAVVVQAQGGSIRGSADSSSTAWADALVLGADSQVTLQGSQVLSGVGTARARGVTVGGARASLELDGCAIVAGVSAQSAGEVLGIEHAGGDLVLVGGSVRALGGADLSRGLRASTLALSTRIEGAQVEAGHAMGNAGTSMAVEVLSGLLTVREDPAGSPPILRAGNATASSIGASLTPAVEPASPSEHLIEMAQIVSGQAAESTGLRLVVPGATQLRASSVQSGTATQGRSAALVVDQGTSITIDACTLEAGTGKTHSVALWTEHDCQGCRIQRCTAVSGAAGDSNAGVSIGLRLARRSGIGQPTLVYSNHVQAGSASTAFGVVVAGNGGTDLRILNNTIDGGGRSGGTSAGVLLGDPVLTGQPTRVAVLVGNIIGAGAGSSSHNIVENGTCQGASSTWAEPVVVIGGRSNNLWPPGATALLRDFHASATISNCADEVTAIATVNTIAPYTSGAGDPNDRTRSEDPLLQGDGVQLSESSPMVDRAYDSALWWPATYSDSMLDIFGVARPLGARHDIGAHEVK